MKDQVKTKGVRDNLNYLQVHLCFGIGRVFETMILSYLGKYGAWQSYFSIAIITPLLMCNTEWDTWGSCDSNILGRTTDFCDSMCNSTFPYCSLSNLGFLFSKSSKFLKFEIENSFRLCLERGWNTWCMFLQDPYNLIEHENHVDKNWKMAVASTLK